MNRAEVEGLACTAELDGERAGTERCTENLENDDVGVGSDDGCGGGQAKVGMGGKEVELVGMKPAGRGGNGCLVGPDSTNDDDKFEDEEVVTDIETS